MPNERTVRRWALEDETFGPQYDQTRRIGYASIFDQILEISDTPVIGTKTITKGNGEVQIIEGDMFEHRRLQIDARSGSWPRLCPRSTATSSRSTIPTKPSTATASP
jgi:hypothetical protein